MEKGLEELIDEVRLLFHALVQRGDRLHADEAITMGKRAVLEYLARNGPTPVPEIARQRRVSRQHIQVLVNPLVEAGLVETAPNPAHRRSALMRLTRQGERTLERMKKRETRFVRRAALDPSEAALTGASKTLRAVRRAIEGDGQS